jgi:hypothetical protein
MATKAESFRTEQQRAARAAHAERNARRAAATSEERGDEVAGPQGAGLAKADTGPRFGARVVRPPG